MQMANSKNMRVQPKLETGSPNLSTPKISSAAACGMLERGLLLIDLFRRRVRAAFRGASYYNTMFPPIIYLQDGSLNAGSRYSCTQSAANRFTGTVDACTVTYRLNEEKYGGGTGRTISSVHVGSFDTQQGCS